MTYRRQLHRPGTHVATVMTALPLGLVVGLFGVMWLQGDLEAGIFEFLAPFAGLGFLFHRVFWSAQAVHATTHHLEVGRGRKLWRVPLADVVSVHRPWWALLADFFIPLRIELRDRRIVLIYPSEEGAEFLLGLGAATEWRQLAPRGRPARRAPGAPRACDGQGAADQRAQSPLLMYPGHSCPPPSSQ